jgi:hypothetical protein
MVGVKITKAHYVCVRQYHNGIPCTSDIHPLKSIWRDLQSITDMLSVKENSVVINDSVPFIEALYQFIKDITQQEKISWNKILSNLNNGTPVQLLSR